MEQQNSIKKNIYYEYLYLNKYDIKYHLISIDSDNFYFIIPYSYQIDYAQSNNNYDDKGYIYFYNNKYSYSIKFIKNDYNSFINHMDNKKKNIKSRFSNYRNQLFFELYNNDNEYIYMYYEGYYFKLCTNHKMSINEYYDMYLILMSMSKNKIVNNLNLIKELYYFDKNGIYNICNDVNLIKSNLREYIKEINLSENDIIITNDSEYIEYKSKQTKIDVISKNLLSNVMMNENEKNSFKFANLGSYNVIVNGYDEIINSDELNEEEKNKLIEKMITQRQNETNSNKDKIDSLFKEYIINFLKNNLSYNLWNLYHVREFINMDRFEDMVNDEDLYNIFINELNSTDILNIKLVEDSIKGHELNIYPNKCVLQLSLLNGLINNLKIIFDEEYNLLDLNN